MADGAPQRLAELWNGVEVSATNSTRRFVVAARSGGQTLLPHFSFKPEKQTDDSISPLLQKLKTGTLVLVELRTGTLVLVEDRNSPTGPVPHSGADSFDCSARDWE